MFDVCLEITNSRLHPGLSGASELTHWGRYASVSSPSLGQVIACRLDGTKPLSEPLLLNGPLETNFSENFTEIYTFLFEKMHLKMSFAKEATILSRPQYVTRALRYAWQSLTRGHSLCISGVIWFTVKLYNIVGAPCHKIYA